MRNMVRVRKKKVVINSRYFNNFYYYSSLLSLTKISKYPGFCRLIFKPYNRVYKLVYSSFRHIIYFRSNLKFNNVVDLAVNLAYFRKNDYLFYKVNYFIITNWLKKVHFKTLQQKALIKRVVFFRGLKIKFLNSKIKYKTNLIRSILYTNKRNLQFFGFKPLLKPYIFNFQNLSFFGNFLPLFSFSQIVFFNAYIALINNLIKDSKYVTFRLVYSFFYQYHNLIKQRIGFHMVLSSFYNSFVHLNKENHMFLLFLLSKKPFDIFLRKYQEFDLKFIFLYRLFIKSNIFLKRRHIKLLNKTNRRFFLKMLFKHLSKELSKSYILYCPKFSYYFTWKFPERYKKHKYKYLYKFYKKRRHRFFKSINSRIRKYSLYVMKKYLLKLDKNINSNFVPLSNFKFHENYFVRKKILPLYIPFFLYSFLYHAKMRRGFLKLFFFKNYFLSKFFKIGHTYRFNLKKNFSPKKFFVRWLNFQEKLNKQKQNVNGIFLFGLNLPRYQFPIKMISSSYKALPLYILLKKIRLFKFYVNNYWYSIFKKELSDPINYFLKGKIYKFYRTSYNNLKYMVYRRAVSKTKRLRKKFKIVKQKVINKDNLTKLNMRKFKLSFAYFSLTGLYSKIKRNLYLKTFVRYIKQGGKNIVFALYNSTKSLYKLRRYLVRTNRIKLTDLSYVLASRYIRSTAFSSFVQLFIYSKIIKTLYDKGLRRASVGFKGPFRIYKLRLRILLYNKYKNMYDKVRYFKKFYISSAQYIGLFTRNNSQYPGFVYQILQNAAGKSYPFLSKNFGLSLTVAGITSLESSLISYKFYNTDFRLRARLFRLSKKLELKFKKLNVDNVLNKENISPNKLTQRIFKLVSTTPFFRSYLRPHFYSVRFAKQKKHEKNYIGTSFLFHRKTRRFFFKKKKSLKKKSKKKYKEYRFISLLSLVKKRYMQPINNFYAFINLFNGRRIIADLKRFKRFDYHNKKTFFNNMFGLKMTTKGLRIRRVFKYVRIIIKQSLGNLFITVLKNHSGEVLLKGSCGIFGDRGPRKFNVFVARRVATKIGFMLSKIKHIKNALVIIKASVFDKKVRTVLYTLSRFVRFVALLKLISVAHNGVRKRKIRRK